MSANQAARRPRAEGGTPQLIIGSAALALLTALLGGASSWPIYQSAQMWLVAGVSALVAYALVLAGRRWRWGALTIVALVAAFVVLTVPLAVPSALGGGPVGVLRGLGDGLASVALGWKQLLTLTLPVGSYQAVLVPLMVVVFGSVALSTALALRGGRAAVFAALPVLVPVLFGTVFGASTVSGSLVWGSVVVPAPREVGIWLLAFGVVAAWISWAAGIARRRAIRLGRQADERNRPRAQLVGRGAAGAAIIAVAVVLGLVVAPLLSGDARSVPRDKIDPELVVRQQSSPLASYREWKRDAAFEAPIFKVSADGELPHRVRIAVLDRYDGVDYSLGPVGDTGRFTRFPSGQPQDPSTDLRITIEDGYRGVWVPIAMPLAEAPTFSGDRANALSDGFYVNRENESAVAVPTESGLRSGDAYEARVGIAEDAELGAEPAHSESLVDLDTMPQLSRWLEVQSLPASGSGLQEAVDRLRKRGYLSHSLTDGDGENQWLKTLSEEHGTKFVMSAGGHSAARIEELFKQLNDQEQAAGERAPDRLLVAGIGDDEQFAAAVALIARSMGFDARVVVGVRLGDGEKEGVPGVPACSEQCTGEHVAAWVEARGSDGVWAPLDVTPQVDIPPTTLKEGEQLPEFPTVPEERDVTESDPSAGSSDSDSDPGDPQKKPANAVLLAVVKTVALSLATLALLALLVLFIPVVKRIRRARRRRGQAPEIRALGAWDELLDFAVDSGMPVNRSRSRREIAAQFPDSGAPWMAWTADRAVYSREGLDDAAVQEMWRVSDETIAQRRRALGFWGRVRARYSLASFKPARGKKMRELLRRAGELLRRSGERKR